MQVFDKSNKCVKLDLSELAFLTWLIDATLTVLFGCHDF